MSYEQLFWHKDDRTKLFNMNPNDNTAKYYDLVYREIKGPDVIASEVLLIKSEVSKNAKILDIGCGTGRHVIPLAAFGFDVTGIDSSAGMLEVLKSKVQSFGLQQGFGVQAKSKVQSSKLKVIKTDFFEYTFNNNQFDLAILMWNAFFEIVLTNSQIEDFFKIMQKILKSGGKILLNIDNAKTIDPLKIESSLISKNESYNLVQNYRSKNLNRKTNTIILFETIKILKKNKFVEEVKSEIRQRWWKIDEIKNIALRFGFSVKLRTLEDNEELYIILTRQ